MGSIPAGNIPESYINIAKIEIIQIVRVYSQSICVISIFIGEIYIDNTVREN